MATAVSIPSAPTTAQPDREAIAEIRRRSAASASIRSNDRIGSLGMVHLALCLYLPTGKGGLKAAHSCLGERERLVMHAATNS